MKNPLLRIGFVLIILQSFVRAVDYEDYDYGDTNIQFDTVHKMYSEPDIGTGSMDLHPPAEPLAVRGAGDRLAVVKPALPLCCPEGQISEFGMCIPPTVAGSWRPRLDGASSARFEFKGFPRCRNQGNKISFYQPDVHFNLDEGSVILPFYVQLENVKADSYCITKVSEHELPSCEMFRTQIVACINENESTPTIVWASVTIAHMLLILTILVFIFMKDYKCLQRQYMICFLISLLIYNLCMFPGSSSSMNVGDVTCIALGAVKYFFFCGIFLWFKVICFDVLRTIQLREDLSSKRRFLAYSGFCWGVGAVLATIVLSIPYMTSSMSENSRNDPLRDSSYDYCKLKMGVDIILQIAQSFFIMVDLLFLGFSTYMICSYNRFNTGLQRCEVSNCLKLTWKLFFIMVAHLLSCVEPTFLTLPVPMWQFVLIESIALFGVLTYRKSVISWVKKGACFSRFIRSETNEDGSLQEKGQLTMT